MKVGDAGIVVELLSFKQSKEEDIGDDGWSMNSGIMIIELLRYFFYGYGASEQTYTAFETEIL